MEVFVPLPGVIQERGCAPLSGSGVVSPGGQEAAHSAGVSASDGRPVQRYLVPRHRNHPQVTAHDAR